MQPSRKAVFLDRDGTLMKEVHYCGDPKLVEAIPGASAALRLIGGQGFARIIITNQSGIGRGYFSEEDFNAVQAELLRQLDGQIDRTYFCPDVDASPRRKPAHGMVLEAAADLGIALSGSWFVGDKDVDIACGRSAGCRTILVETGYGASHLHAEPDFVAKDVADAVQIILREIGGTQP